ncbi:hypothetical protein [Niallia sp. 01092]|uniref:hypothetical protein n=1 Tax=unclassified Niallia TaxID=2837522 RepID=UPI003FD4E81A
MGETTLLSIRGKDATAKAQAITSLNKGQQALCMFRVFYDHAKNSAIEYYSWVAYLLQTPGYWPGVTEGLLYFEDQNMLQLLEDTNKVIEERNNKFNGIASFKDLEQDNELSYTVNRLYERFQEIVPNSLKRISTYIRMNQHDFVIIVK